MKTVRYHKRHANTDIVRHGVYLRLSPEAMKKLDVMIDECPWPASRTTIIYKILADKLGMSWGDM